MIVEGVESPDSQSDGRLADEGQVQKLEGRPAVMFGRPYVLMRALAVQKTLHARRVHQEVVKMDSGDLWDLLKMMVPLLWRAWTKTGAGKRQANSLERALTCLPTLHV